MYFSIIIPVYNRPAEIKDLLESLKNQTYKNFEIVLVEDGSQISCKHIMNEYTDLLNTRYFSKPNTGPGLSRNYGAKRSKGNYLIFFDSDCIIPPDYLEKVYNYLSVHKVDLYGGPDAASPAFSSIQQAINYSMTSFITTGGIRGGKNKLDRFFPRTFNLGVNKELFFELKGFSDMRFGEDLDFSIRAINKGSNCKYLPQAWVYHKRRANLRQFFKQVHNSGRARINLYQKYPDTLKLVHLLPALFIVGVLLFIGLTFYNILFFMPLFLFIVFIFIDSLLKTRQLKVSFLSVASSFTQLLGYGSGFLVAWWQQCILRTGYRSGFNKSFYK